MNQNLSRYHRQQEIGRIHFCAKCCEEEEVHHSFPRSKRDEVRKTFNWMSNLSEQHIARQGRILLTKALSFNTKQKRVSKSHPTVFDMIADPELSRHFEAFCHLHYCAEEYGFFRDVNEYERQFTVSDDAWRRATARKIADKYLKPGAPFEINVSYDVRSAVNDHLAHDKPIMLETLFDEAVDEVTETMTPMVLKFMQS